MKNKNEFDEMNESGFPQGNQDFQEDESKDIIEVIKKNSNLIITAAVVVIVAVAAVVYMNNSAEEKFEEASVALSRITPSFEDGNFENAVNGDPSLVIRGEKVLSLPEVANKYKGTEPGKIAALYAGQSYLALDDVQNAKKYFEIAEGSASDVVKMGAFAGLGAVAEFNGELEKSVGLYEKAANQSNDSALKARYLLYAALVYEELGNNEKAKNLFEEVIVRGENSEFAELAKAGIIRVGTIIE